MGTAWKVEGTKSSCANDSDFVVVFVLFKRELRRVEEFEKIASELVKSVLKGQPLPLVIFTL